MRVGTIIGFQNPAQWRVPWPELYESGLRFAEEAEALGLDEVWLTEHHFADDGYCPALLPVAAAIAARTTRIRIGTKVVLLPFHNPLRLAEDVAVVDVLSGGRFDLGVAAGYRHEEFAGFGIDRSERGARTREGIALLRQALTGEPVDFEGRFFRHSGVRITPPPLQQPVPLWVGGRSERPLRRAATDGLHLQLADFDVELCERDHRVYTEALRAAGRDPADYEVAAVASVFVDEDPERALALAGPHLRYQQAQYQRWFAEAGDRTSAPLDDEAGELPPGCLVGTPADVLEQIRAAHARVPFTHFSFWILAPGMAPDVATRSLRLFAAEVLPALRALR